MQLQLRGSTSFNGSLGGKGKGKGRGREGKEGEGKGKEEGREQRGGEGLAYSRHLGPHKTWADSSCSH